MKTKNLLLGLLVLVLLVLLYFIFTYEEKTFVEYKIGDKNIVVNRTNKSYLDTIVHVGLDYLKIEGQTVIVRPQNGQRDLGDDFSSEAFIINQGNQSLVMIKERLNRSNAIEILAHELIHLQQYKDKRLVVLDGGRVEWNGDTLVVEQIPYDERPWEVEAFLYGKMLEQDIKKILYE